MDSKSWEVVSRQFIPQKIKEFYPPYEAMLTRDEVANPSNLFQIEFNNIRIHTDSENLAQFTQIVANERFNNEPKRSLYFLTEDIIQSPSGNRLLIASPNMEEAAISGDELPGTLLSLIFGIEEYDLANTPIIGLHSTSIFDTQTGEIHLLVGKSKIGKTTHGFLLEQMSGGRLKLIGDEWNYLDMKSQSVAPALRLIGEIKNTQIQEDFQQVMQNKRFISIGPKKFWENNISINHGKLGKILLLADTKSFVNISEEVLKAHKNIPFIGSDLNSIPKSEESLYSSLKKDLKKIKQKLETLPNLEVALISSRPEDCYQNSELLLKLL